MNFLTIQWIMVNFEIQSWSILQWFLPIVQKKKKKKIQIQKLKPILFDYIQLECHV